ncbi:MAG: hypothetical protein QM621_08945 [Aeromicrobium sp.]
MTALLAVVVIVTVVDRADATDVDSEAVADPVCTMSDSRVDEQSGLAISVAHDQTAYMVNDSGNAPEVYAVDLTTCEIVGVTTVRDADWTDPEAMALDGDGTLWIADTGDNDGVRDHGWLYALPEPGRSDDAVTPEQYPIAYPAGAEDVESLAVDGSTGRMWLVTKGWMGGELLELPAELSTTEVTMALSTGVDMPILVTDAAMTADGHYLLVRTYLRATLYDAEDGFAMVEDIELPGQSQGETVAVDPTGTSLIVGSEGLGEQLFRVPLTTPEKVEPAPQPQPASAVGRGAADLSRWMIVGAVGAALLLVGGLVALRARRRS